MNISGIVALSLLGLLLSGCLMPEPIEQERALFQEKVADNPAITHHWLAVGESTLHYVAAGDPQKPALIIMHGTPGSWRQYSRYILEARLLSNYYMIVIDRPGWGESTLGGDQLHASFEQQSAIIAVLAKQLKADNGKQAVVLAGHSLGSSIAPRVAMDYPELIDGLLLFAGTHDPELGGPRWYNRLARFPGVGLLVGDGMMRANKEVYSLKDNLERMLPLWGDIQAQTTVVQGMNDDLVFPANIDFTEKMLPSETTTIIRLDEEGHLFPMTLRDQVMDWALALLARIEKRG